MNKQELTDIVQESLRDWFKKEKWVRITTSGNIAGPCGTSKNKKNPDRCLPKAKAQSLSKSERAATARKKKQAGKKGKTVVKNTKKAKVTRETKEAPDGHYFTKSGNLVKGRMSKDAKEKGARKSDPKDKMRSKIPKVTQYTETANPQDGKAAPYGSGYGKVTKEGKFDDMTKFDLVRKNPFDIKKLVDKGIIHVTAPGDGEGGIGKPNWEGDASIITLLNLRKADPWMKKAITMPAPKAIPHVQDAQEDLFYNGKYNQILWSIDKKGFKPEEFYLKSKRVTKEDITNLIVGLIHEDKGKEILTEKDDRCTRIAKRKYDTWPSAYASGAVVRCRRGDIWKKEK